MYIYYLLTLFFVLSFIRKLEREDKRSQENDILSQMIPQMSQWSQVSSGDIGAVAQRNMARKWFRRRGGSSSGMMRKCVGEAGYGGDNVEYGCDGNSLIGG